MYEQVEKSKENKSTAVANSVAQKKRGVKQGFGFVDNRPEALAGPSMKENIVQRTVLLEQDEDKSKSFRTARGVAGQDELDYSAKKYQQRYGTNVIELGDTTEKVNTGEVLYVIGHRFSQTKFTQFGNDLVDILKGHGIQAGMTVDLVGCQTEEANVVSELKKMGVKVVSHPDIHITTATGDHVVSHNVANQWFATKKKDLENMTDEAVKKIVDEINSTKTESDKKIYRDDYINFLNSVQHAFPHFKLVNFKVVKKDNLISSTINTNLTKITGAISGKKHDYKNMDEFINFSKSAYGNLFTSPIKKAIGNILDINRQLVSDAIAYQRDYEAKLVVEQKIKDDPQALRKSVARHLESISTIYDWSKSYIESEISSGRHDKIAKEQMIDREKEPPSYIR